MWFFKTVSIATHVYLTTIRFIRQEKTDRAEVLLKEIN
jgi:hypothetical protein